MKSLNERTVTMKLKRIELCDLLLATTVLTQSNPDAQKWEQLHGKLKEILDAFDAAQSDI